ncbi:hypothetical protein BDV3_003400 [Batrachochytrium dendrobatidis]
MATTLPREIIKWIQGLDLSYSVKNYKRDFSNGFLVAEILAKYYPADVQMHAFDTGTGGGAKNNNWGMLERVFIKHSIPISKEICANVASCSSESASILLSVIYWHINNKGSHPEGVLATTASISSQTKKSASKTQKASSGGSSNKTRSNTSDEQEHQTALDRILFSARQNSLMENFGTESNDGLDEPLHLNISNGYSPGKLSKMNANAVLDTDGDPSTEEPVVGRVSLMRVICQIFNIADTQINFHRSTFPANTVRDIICQSIETGSRFEVNALLEILRASTPEIISAIQQSPPLDFQILFDTFLPLIVNYGSSTKVFQAATAIIYYVGDTCQYMLATGKSYKWLSMARDFNGVIQQISLPTMDKMPFIARILHAYLGPNISEIDRVRIFMEIKASIHKDKLQWPATRSKSSSGSEFIFFLASFNAIYNYPIHSATYQFTVLHLSECLTIINAFKRSNQGNVLFLPLKNGSTTISDTSANPGVTILSTADIPALEVSAALHIVAAIIRAGVPLEHRVMADVVDSSLRAFLKIVINPQCPCALQKAYMKVVVTLLEILPIDCLRESPEFTLLQDLLGIANTLLKWFTGEVLKTMLIFISKVLYKHQTLCTAFVRGLVNAGDTVRLDLLKATTKKNSNHTITWNLPFLLDENKPQIYKVWWEYGVCMGVRSVTECSKSPLEASHLEIIWTMMRERRQSECTDDQNSRPIVPQAAWNHVFLLLSDHIIANLAIQELSDLAWSVFCGFMQVCSGDTITKKFPSLLGVLIYVHTVDRGRCRKRIMNRLKRWAAKASLKAKFESDQPTKLDSYALEQKSNLVKESLSHLPKENEHTIYVEAQRVLRIFMNELPTLSGSGKRHLAHGL